MAPHCIIIKSPDTVVQVVFWQEKTVNSKVKVGGALRGRKVGGRRWRDCREKSFLYCWSQQQTHILNTDPYCVRFSPHPSLFWTTASVLSSFSSISSSTALTGCGGGAGCVFRRKWNNWSFYIHDAWKIQIRSCDVELCVCSCVFTCIYDKKELCFFFLKTKWRLLRGEAVIYHREVSNFLPSCSFLLSLLICRPEHWTKDAHTAAFISLTGSNTYWGGVRPSPSFWRWSYRCGTGRSWTIYLCVL